MPKRKEIKADHVLFRKCCVAVYGERFKCKAAEKMKVDRITIDRWCEGFYPVSDEAWFQLFHDALDGSKTLIKAASKKGIDFPVIVKM